MVLAFQVDSRLALSWVLWAQKLSLVQVEVKMLAWLQLVLAAPQLLEQLPVAPKFAEPCALAQASVGPLPVATPPTHQLPSCDLVLR